MIEAFRAFMAGKGITGRLSGHLKYYSWLALILWTGCVASSLAWNLLEHRENTLRIALNSAQITFENDILYRKWAAKQGGVYVPSSENTPLNPYLPIPTRTVMTSSGLSLTLVNPASMARQVNEMAKDLHSSRGHLTSLNPIRPENKPDSWEAAALKSFEGGVTEVSSLETIDGKEYMRMMRPFATEKSCLKCHAAQGYKEGDIRGGISVAIPMMPLWTIERPHVLKMWLAHLFLWMTGMAGIVLARKNLVKQVFAREEAEAALRERTGQVETAIQEFERFGYSVAHDFRALLRAIDGYSKMLMKKYGDSFEDDALRLLTVIRSKTDEMGSLIDGIVSFSRVLTNSMNISSIDMEDLINDVWKDIRKADPDREFDVKITHILPGFGDRSLIRQLLFNLLSNAVKFTKNRKPAVIEMSSYQESDQVVYCLKDNGVGFDMAYSGKLFDIFQRLHNPEEYEGIGVGLAIAKRIMQRHGGRVWAEGAVDKGATFFFTLPGKAMK